MNDIVSLSSLSNAASGSELHVEHARAADQSALRGALGSTTRAGSQEDSIELSTAADLVQRASSAGASARASRVEQLKQQIESGRYSVEPRALSSAVIDATVAGE